MLRPSERHSPLLRHSRNSTPHPPVIVIAIVIVIVIVVGEIGPAFNYDLRWHLAQGSLAPHHG